MRQDYFIMQELAAVQGNFFWGVSKDNKLYKTNLETGEMEFIFNFGCFGDMEYLFNNMFIYENKIILLPGELTSIVVYYTDTGKVELYDYDGNDDRYETGVSFCKFSCGIVYKNYLFAFPANMPYILRINLENMSREYIYAPINEYLAKYGGYSALFISVYGRLREKIWIPCCEQNLVFVMNLKTLEYKWQELQAESNSKGYISCTNSRDTLFLINIKGEMLCFALESLQFQTIYAFNRLGNIFGNNKFLWFVPLDKSKIISFLYETGAIEQYDYDSRFRFSPKLEENVVTFSRAVQDNGLLYIVPRYCNGIIMLSTEKNASSFLKISFKLTEDFLELFDKQEASRKGKIYSEWELDLSMLVEKTENINMNDRVFQNIGEKIYHSI